MKEVIEEAVGLLLEMKSHLRSQRRKRKRKKPQQEQRRGMVALQEGVEATSKGTSIASS